MFLDITKCKIFIKPGPTDFRKQINGLSIIVQDQMKLNPLDNNLFIFSNKSRNRLKVLYWEKIGFCLWFKRLEVDKFPWPQNTEDALEIDASKLRLLLAGIDFWKAHKELKFSEIS